MNLTLASAEEDPPSVASTSPVLYAFKLPRLHRVARALGDTPTMMLPRDKMFGSAVAKPIWNTIFKFALDAQPRNEARAEEDTTYPLAGAAEDTRAE
jgi:hypothetical protein